MVWVGVTYFRNSHSLVIIAIGLSWAVGIGAVCLMNNPNSKSIKLLWSYKMNRDFENMNGEEWSNLLQKRPQFADKCDWSELSGDDWIYLLEEQPQFKVNKAIMEL
jgi:hypothetical protein